MKIYLAARYSKHPEMQKYAKMIETQGHEITSRWIWGDHQIQDLSDVSIEDQKLRFMEEDFEDLIKSELVINFTEEPRSTNSRGGRHVEYGIALGMNIRCVVVGPQENIFHAMPNVRKYSTFNDFFTELVKEKF